MIRKFLGKVFSGRLFRSGSARIIRSHHISRDSVSRCAISTCETLQKNGHTAYLVGGAVRDLLLGKTPKDFDIATSAHPEQVRALFRRSRIIGRRFRLVHVLCGNDMVEVSTFRGDGATLEGDDTRKTDEHGRILRDNVFGTLEDDARRRDFTVNALFYDPVRGEVLDYHDGFADLRARRLRIIGDAAQRYREDPVRMLRAARFAAALDFEIEPLSRKPIRSLAKLLQNVPPSRLFDEMLKLLLSGHAAAGVRRLRVEGLHHGMLPLLDVILEQPLGERFVMLALANTDKRAAENKPVSPGFLFATLLWHEVLAGWKKTEAGGMNSIPALYKAMEQVLLVQSERFAIPRRYSGDMKEIWALQPRFENRAGRRPLALLTHPRFRAAFDFLRLRCESGEIDAEICAWWDTFQHGDEAERGAMLARNPPSEGARRRRPRRRRKASAVADAASGS